MKRIILFLSFVLTSIFGFSQRRELPNQFRDFLDHKQMSQQPSIERKDGKVVITMTEQQFDRMRQIRESQKARFMSQRSNPSCDKCVRKHKRHNRKHRHFKF